MTSNKHNDKGMKEFYKGLRKLKEMTPPPEPKPKRKIDIVEKICLKYGFNQSN